MSVDMINRDGVVIKTDTVGDPHGFAFDGKNLWLIWTGQDELVCMSRDFKVIKTITLPDGEIAMSDITFDGVNIVGYGNTNGKFYQIDREGRMIRSVTPAFTVTGGRAITHIDGRYAFLHYNGDFGAATFGLLDRNFMLIRNQAFQGINGSPRGLTFDGKDLWAVGSSPVELHRLNILGDEIKSVDMTGVSSTDIRGLEFDGVNLWTRLAAGNGVE